MIYWDLFFSFFKVGLFSFGGAYGAIPIIRDMVLDHGWLTDEKLTYMIGLSESTPGPIMVNLATFVGKTQGGFLGAFLATLGVVLPSFCVILLLTSLLKNATKSAAFQALLNGLKPCVIGIILATGLHLIVSNAFDWTPSPTADLRAVVITPILVGILVLYERLSRKPLSPILFIFIAAAVGLGVCEFV